jgi:hypothetical protein
MCVTTATMPVVWGYGTIIEIISQQGTLPNDHTWLNLCGNSCPHPVSPAPWHAASPNRTSGGVHST